MFQVPTVCKNLRNTTLMDKFPSYDASAEYLKNKWTNKYINLCDLGMSTSLLVSNAMN